MSRTIDLSPAKLAIILGAVLVLLAGATWFMLVSPKQNKADSLSSSIHDEQAQLAQLKQAHAQSAARSASEKLAVSQAVALTRAMPPVVGMPQIVLQLSRIATEEHVVLNSIAPAAAVPYTTYQALPVTIGLTGDYRHVQGFLQQLRQQVTPVGKSVTATGRLYDVLSVSLQSTTPAPQVTATVTLDAFSYTGVAATPDTTATTPTG